MRSRRGTKHAARFLTVDWLGGPIRMCTSGYRSNADICMVWALWDRGWSGDFKRLVDAALAAAAKEQKAGLGQGADTPQPNHFPKANPVKERFANERDR